MGLDEQGLNDIHQRSPGYVLRPIVKRGRDDSACYRFTCFVRKHCVQTEHGRRETRATRPVSRTARRVSTRWLRNRREDSVIILQIRRDALARHLRPRPRSPTSGRSALLGGSRDVQRQILPSRGRRCWLKCGGIRLIARARGSRRRYEMP